MLISTLIAACFGAYYFGHLIAWIDSRESYVNHEYVVEYTITTVLLFVIVLLRKNIWGIIKKLQWVANLKRDEVRLTIREREIIKKLKEDEETARIKANLHAMELYNKIIRGIRDERIKVELEKLLQEFEKRIFKDNIKEINDAIEEMGNVYKKVTGSNQIIILRNSVCPICNSGKRFKVCCGELT